MSPFKREAPPTLELVLDDDLERRYDRLLRSSAPLDRRPESIFKAGLESLGGTAPPSTPSPQEVLAGEKGALERLLDELAMRRVELEKMQERKMKHEEERTILEYYLWVIDQQIEEMERKVKETCGKT